MSSENGKLQSTIDGTKLSQLRPYALCCAGCLLIYGLRLKVSLDDTKVLYRNFFATPWIYSKTRFPLLFAKCSQNCLLIELIYIWRHLILV